MDAQNIWVTFPELLIWGPLLAGLIAFFIRNPKHVKTWAILASLLTLSVSITSLSYTHNNALNGLSFGYEWLKYLGSSFTIGLDGMGRILTLLTAIAFPLIFIATSKTNYKNAHAFYGLMLLTQSGLMGVFCAMDALVFYFFWELALIPVYFLCSRWGGPKRIQATFKFFVYTFAGSLLMLIGIIYVYQHTPPVTFADGTTALHSFGLRSFHISNLTSHEQMWMFWLFFIAFAIKMPIFPFHTWQPDTYEQAPSAVTMVLSGVMVKMGVFALVRWLIPIFPEAANKFNDLIITFAVIGMIYASCLAMVQDNLKRLVAYSSIAHIGLMCAAIFANNDIGFQGVMIQMFNHGINIIGLWIMVDVIDRQLGVQKISQLGGVAHKAPVLTMLFMVIALANIALPLTNAFVGEFLMLSGLYQFNVWVTAAAGLCIILSAIYMLNMIQKVFYGETNTITSTLKEISVNEKIVLSLTVMLILAIGVYPQPLLNLTKEVTAIIKFN